VAGRGASHQAAQAPPIRAGTESELKNDKRILEMVNSAVEYTDMALKGASKLEAQKNLETLALRDGMGVMKAVTLDKTRLPAILDFAKQCGRMPTIVSTLGTAGKGIQMIDIALKFSDPDVYRGIETLVKAMRDPSRSWNINAQRLLENMKYE
jgi:hypothetical protein